MRRFDLVSVDVWDTILRRSVHPDEVKFHVARWLQLHHSAELRLELAHDLRALFAARRKAEDELARDAAEHGYDDEYTLDEVQHRWLASVLREPRADRTALRAELTACEIEFERTTTTLDPGILDALRPYAGIPIVLASDFYLGARPLLDLVLHAGFDLPLRAVYVSCDHRLSKRSGRLFRKIQADLKVAPSRHLHVGDNATSDVAVPRGLGMGAIYYRNSGSDSRRRQNEIRFGWREKRIAPAKLVHEAQARVCMPRELAGDARECFALGVRHGLPFIAFVLAVMEDALRKKYQRIHYFTREGVFFHRLHDALARHAVFPAPPPQSALLTVSRVSTFAASLGALVTRREAPKIITPYDMMAVWRLFSTQSTAAMMATLGEAPKDYATLFARHGIEPNQPVDCPWQDCAIGALFGDPDFQARLAVALDGRRRRLLRYLAANGLGPGVRRAAIVDIGWRGTIQDNIAELLPDTAFEGWYLGLNTLLNPQPKNVTKHGLLCDRNLPTLPAASPTPAHVALEFPSVVEMLCNSATGSALDYASTPDNTEPITDHHPGEDGVWFRRVRFFQDGVLALIPHLSDGLRRHVVEAGELLIEARRELARLITSPPAALARAYFELTHNEGFGLGCFVDKRAPFPRSVTDLEDSGWPQGLLRRYRLSVLLPLFNRRVMKLDADGYIHR